MQYSEEVALRKVGESKEDNMDKGNSSVFRVLYVDVEKRTQACSSREEWASLFIFLLPS